MEILISAVIDIVTIILYLRISVKNPGYLINDGTQFMELLEEYHPQYLCPECEIMRPPRSVHCILCKKCVDIYDHHCQWIDNCIGSKNQSVFIVYLVF